MFALPRSSWADYDGIADLGGRRGVPRTAKVIALTDEVRAALGIAEREIEPGALISAILKSPVDLIWFGGIGTYVKARAENNIAVGDPANDRSARRCRGPARNRDRRGRQSRRDAGRADRVLGGGGWGADQHRLHRQFGRASIVRTMRSTSRSRSTAR